MCVEDANKSANPWTFSSFSSVWGEAEEEVWRREGKEHNILLHSSPPTYTRPQAHTDTRTLYDGIVEADRVEGVVEPDRVYAEGQVLHRSAPLHWDTFISLAHFGVIWVQMRK